MHIAYEKIQPFTWWGGTTAVLLPTMLIARNMWVPIVCYYATSTIIALGQLALKKP